MSKKRTFQMTLDLVNALAARNEIDSKTYIELLNRAGVKDIVDGYDQQFIWDLFVEHGPNYMLLDLTKEWEKYTKAYFEQKRREYGE